jgi:hypothetical protein
VAVRNEGNVFLLKSRLISFTILVLNVTFEFTHSVGFRLIVKEVEDFKCATTGECIYEFCWAVA